MDTAVLVRNFPYVRFGYAVAALFTPKVAAAAILAKPSEMTPAAVSWAALFATREAALGAITMESERLDPATRRKVLLLNAAVDGVDAAAIFAFALRRRSIPLFLLVPAGIASVIAHVQAAQALDGLSSPAGETLEKAYATA